MKQKSNRAAGASGPVVIKVGGALLGGGTDLARVGRAIAERRRRGEPLLVVASALSGVTDRLERAVWRALDRGADSAEPVAALARFHRRVAEEAGIEPPPELEPRLAELERGFARLARAGAIDPALRARLLSYGERLCAPLLAAAVTAAGVPARAATAEQAGIVARGPRSAGRCDLAATARRLAALAPELATRVVVLTGFYGVDEAGGVVVFGRGGSDYTAGAVAAALDAEALELWKDVPGILSADPGTVPSARLVPSLSFAEAARLCSFGARVLHPRCLQPLAGRRVRVEVLGCGAGTGAGTRLIDRRPAAGSNGGAGTAGDAAPRVAGLGSRRGRIVVRLDPGALTPGAGREIAGRLGELGRPLERAAERRESRSGLAFGFDEAALPAVESVLGGLNGYRSAVALERRPALLGVVGDGVAGDAVIRARMVGGLATLGVPAAAIAGTACGTALRCALPDRELGAGLAGLHALFF
jgi:aspartate kinase